MQDKHLNNTEGSAYKKRSLFGRRQGRALKGERSVALDTVLPEIQVPDDILSEAHDLIPASLFKNYYSAYHLEIGFGHGERLIEDTQKNKDIAFLGAEPFINGMADFLKNIPESSCENTRVIMDDGMILARSITPQSIDKIYVLNPDPWHKTRHHKRRIINQENLTILSHILKPNGKLVLTTDVPDLADWMCTQANNHPDFVWDAKTKTDWSTPPQDWIKTRYELKGAKGAKKMAYMIFTKI